jgi:carboxylesterase
MVQIVSGSEPYLFPGGRTGCILLHGFTSMPEETRLLGQYLAENGFTTLGLRLSGHATHPLDLRQTRWTDWLLDVESALALLSRLTDRVFLIGQSMGGMISLVSAAEFPLAGVVAVSTPASPAPVRHLFGYYFQNVFIRNIYKESYKFSRNSGYRREANYPAYPYYPSCIHLEVYKLQRRLGESLPKVRIPALIIQAHDDPWIPPSSAEFILDHILSTHKSIFWLEKAGHSILLNENRQIAFKAILDFIKENEAA